MNTVRPFASLSIDLDDLWSYLRTSGDSRWTSFPSFLDVAVPRALNFFARNDLKATFFLVGRDAERPELKDMLREIPAAGHEIANHSYDHRADIHRLPRNEIRDDFNQSEAAIVQTTGTTPTGFRGPSFRSSNEIRAELIRRNYRYDSSVFPTFIGPLARTYHFATSSLSPEQKLLQKDLFGTWSDALVSQKPFEWRTGDGVLLEIPVTTFPLLRIPVHMTYINFIADRSEKLADYYFRGAVNASAARCIPFSMLLHAADFIGDDDPLCPRFLPGMKRQHHSKLELMGSMIKTLGRKFDLHTIDDVAHLFSSNNCPTRSQ